MQIQTNLRTASPPVRMAIPEKSDNNIGEDVEEKGPSFTAGWDAN